MGRSDEQVAGSDRYGGDSRYLSSFRPFFSRCSRTDLGARVLQSLWIYCLSTAREYCSYPSRLALSSDAFASSIASEFLIHAADVEGLCQGIDEELVESTSRLLSSSILVS